MILTDSHVHSDVSQDSKTSMVDMVRATAAAGVERMCFTNHCDPVDWRTYKFRDACRDIVPESMRKYREMVEQYGEPPIEVGIGIELGEPLFAPDVIKEIAGTPGLDFVIGSLHILQEYGDFCWLKYESLEFCNKVFGVYLDELLKMAEMDYYDVMAHIGYGRRYMFRQGLTDAMLSLALFGDKIEELLRRIIDRGRGIEINCSGIRDGCGPFPQPEILRLYRQLGGEIITVGSDAHNGKDAGGYIRDGCEILKACGFEYVSYFRQRKPEFIKL